MERVTVQYATGIVLEAIKSGALKLQGAGTTPEASRERADTDAAYILQLLTKLTGKTDD